MAKTIKSFHQRTTKAFDVLIKYNNVPQNISGDDVYLVLEDTATTLTALNVAADVASEGASGIAKFVITDENSDIVAQEYKLQIVWETAGGERYIVHEQLITVMESVSETVGT